VDILDSNYIDSSEVFELLMEKENKIKILEEQIKELKLLTKLTPYQPPELILQQ